MNHAAESYSASEDERAFSAMIEQMLKATDRAENAIDDALAFINASNQRIVEMKANS